MVRYPVILKKDDNDTLMVTFPDFPEAHTFGDTEGTALAHAVDALETVIDAYIRDRRPVPGPSAIKRHAVALPALVATKVALHNAMRDQGITKAELTKRLGVHPPQVDRLLDVRHGSQLDQLEAAAKALGGTLDVSLRIERIPVRGKGQQPPTAGRVRLRKLARMRPASTAAVRGRR